MCCYLLHTRENACRGRQLKEATAVGHEDITGFARNKTSQMLLGFLQFCTNGRSGHQRVSNSRQGFWRSPWLWSYGISAPISPDSPRPGGNPSGRSMYSSMLRSAGNPPGRLRLCSIPQLTKRCNCVSTEGYERTTFVHDPLSTHRSEFLKVELASTLDKRDDSSSTGTKSQIISCEHS